ncbi:MAG: GTP 3',8-cyclase MoaA [Anaerolineales bacterium]|nr:GTP 3',8-cyclase MoaA [Anaerolineales bacterium]
MSVNPKDAFQRQIRDLRISVTDRCNFRCIYCMPKEFFGREYEFLKRVELLTFEEIARLTRIFNTLGAKKVRITGGEPLIRRDIEDLISLLSTIPDLDLTLTTNGSLLAQKASALKDAGLKRVTVSLDALDDETFKAMNDVNFPVESVLKGIEAASEVGLNPVKINMVVKRGINENSILPMVRHFRNSGHILRFIEYMDVGTTNGWRLDQIVSINEILGIIDNEFPIEPLEPNYQGEVAKRWVYKDGAGEIGVIASVTSPFCGNCTRIRLSAEGRLYTCLFGTEGTDLRGLIRGGKTNDDISDFIFDVWQKRNDRYSEIRSSKTAELKRVEMSYIGG